MADEIKKLKDMVDKRKGKMSNRLEPYVSSALHMGHAASTRTAGMIEIESQIAKLERQREINRENISQFMTQFAKSPSTPEEVNKAFQRHNREAERLQASYELWQSKYQVEKEKREQVARNRFETQVTTSAESGMSFTSLDPVEKARALKVAESGIASGSFSESSIYKGISRLGAQSIRRKEALIEEAKNPAGSIEAFIERAENLESTKSKLTTLQAAQQVLKSQGLDTESVYRTSKGRLNEILEKRQDLALQSKIQSKEVGSFSQESNKLKELEDKFVEAQQKFVDALDGPTEELEEFKKSVINAGKSLDDQKKLVDEMKKQGVGDRADNIATRLSQLGQIGAAAANVYSYATIGSENQQISQRAQFARIQNQIFMDHYAAAKGDMAALGLVEAQAAARSVNLGVEQSEQMRQAKLLEVAGETAKGASIVAGATGSLDADVAIGMGINTAEKLSILGTDAYKGISKNQAAIEGFYTRYDLSRATDEVRAKARQIFFDQSMTNFAATQGFGSRRSDTFAEMQASRMGMAELGVTTEEQAAMYQTALLGMGSEFTKLGTKGAQDLVTRAAKVGVSGVTSAQDYLARIGQVAEVGGSQKQVEDILANAVARGVDDAKSFGEMVDSISQLSSSSAIKGIDTSNIVTANILSGMDAMKGSGINNRLALNAVQTGYKTLQDISSDTGLNFGNMISYAKLGQLDLDQYTKENVMGMSKAEISSIHDAIKKGDIKKARTMASIAGIESAYFDEKGLKKDVNKTMDVMEQSADEKILAELLSRTSREEAEKIMKPGAKLTPKQADLLKAATGANRFSLQAYHGKDFSKEELKELTGPGATAQRGKVASAVADARMAGAGEAMSFDQRTGAKGLDQIVANLEKISKSLEPVAAATKAATGAAEMKLDTGSFDKSVENFGTAVQMLIKALGEKGGPKSENFANEKSTNQSLKVEKPLENRNLVMPGRTMPGRGNR